jgi:hypothetical protein
LLLRKVTTTRENLFQDEEEKEAPIEESKHPVETSPEEEEQERFDTYQTMRYMNLDEFYEPYTEERQLA